MVTPPEFDAKTRERLEEILARVEGPSLPYVDGFLTAVAIGPDMLLPSQWWPALWDGGEPASAGDEEAEFLPLAAVGRLDQIMAALDAEDGTYAPILQDAASGMRVEDWAQGFHAGSRLMGEDWVPLLDDEQGRMTFTALVALSRTEGGGNLLGMDAERVKTLRESAPEFIPGSVAYIHGFWLTRQAHAIAGRPLAPASHEPRRAAKVGRNDPCPCGSGKKYKKCCGAK